MQSIQIQLKHVQRFIQTAFAGLVLFISMLTGSLAANTVFSPQQMIDSVGLEPHLRLLHRSYLKTGLEGAENAGPASQPFFDRWAAATQEIWSPQAMRARIAAKLEGQFTAAEQAALARFYNSPLGRKITQLETEKKTMTSQVQSMFGMMMNPGEMMSRASQAPDRIALCRNLDQAMSERDFATLVTAYHSVADDLIVLSQGVDIGADALKWRVARKLAEEKAAKAQRLGPMDNFRIFQQYSAFRDLPTPQLKAYLTFLSTPVGQKFNRTITAAVQAALDDAVLAFRQRLLS